MTPADYDAWYDSPRGRWIDEIEYRLVDDQLAARVGARILDVGCGTGWFTRRFASVRGLHVTGIDVDAAALDFARRHDHLASYLRADARRLPFADGSFDGVVSITALCFVPDWPSAPADRGLDNAATGAVALDQIRGARTGAPLITDDRTGKRPRCAKR